MAQWPSRALEITQRARRLCTLPYTYGTADGPPGTRRTLVGAGRRRRPQLNDPLLAGRSEYAALGMKPMFALAVGVLSC